MKKHLWKNRAPWLVFSIIVFVIFCLMLGFSFSQEHEELTPEEIRKAQKLKRGPPPSKYKPLSNIVPENDRPGLNVS